MKNKFFTVLFSLFLSGIAVAQSGRVGEHSAITTWKEPAGISTAAQGKAIAQSIINALGLRTNFDIRPANIENAAAVVYGGKRYVLFNPTFINNLVKTTGTEWAAISVLAHEIGHHLNGHTVSGRGSKPETELEADEFSGYVLRKMGASLQAAQSAMQTLASARATRTHPAKYDRLTAIADGWNYAGDQLAGRQRSRENTEQSQQREEPVTRSRVRLDSRFILGDVYFTADPESQYHVTTNYTLVKLNNGSLNVLGKLAKLNSDRFPYLIYDAQNTQLLVDAGGKIVTSSGKQVGLLKNHEG